MLYIKRFDELGRGDIDLAGGKGANLGELTRAGLPVPPGFVLTTAALPRCSSSRTGSARRSSTWPAAAGRAAGRTTRPPSRSGPCSRPAR